MSFPRNDEPREQKRAREAEPRPKAYESPRLKVVGTVAEMTKGIIPTSVDTVLPGSLN